MTISANLIPTVKCIDFSTFKKAISQIEDDNASRLNFDCTFGKDHTAFHQFVIDFVELFAIKAYRKGNKEYAYNLRYLKNLLIKDGSCIHINGFVANVSKKSLYETIRSIEDFYINKTIPC